MEQVYAEHKDADGFLYMVYTDMQTSGCPHS